MTFQYLMAKFQILWEIRGHSLLTYPSPSTVIVLNSIFSTEKKTKNNNNNKT